MQGARSPRQKTFPYPRSAAHIDAAKCGTQAAKLPVKRRLVFVATDGWWLWLHWAGLLKAARAAGYDVTVVTRAGEHEEQIRELGFDFLNMDFGRGRLSPTVNLRTLRRLYAIYRRIRPDLVHHVTLQPTVLGSTAAAVTDDSGVAQGPCGAAVERISTSRSQTAGEVDHAGFVRHRNQGCHGAFAESVGQQIPNRCATAWISGFITEIARPK